MKFAIIGGAGAMGAVIGGRLAKAGSDVTLIDVARPAIESIHAHGLHLTNKSGEEEYIPVKATMEPTTVGVVDVVVVFVKCYHTEAAVKAAVPLIGPNTAVLSLQNGWGNASRIANIVGEPKVLAGVTYHSATVLGPGHVKQTGIGATYIGELNGPVSQRVQQIVDAFNQASMEAQASSNVLKTIWQKLALNVCTLPASALLRFTADEMAKHDGAMQLMSRLLREAIAVANAQQIDLEYDERWEVIVNLLKRAVGGKASMLQDVEARRRTEIDVVNGAIVEAGQRLGIPTPYNQTMVWMVKALEETF